MPGIGYQNPGFFHGVLLVVKTSVLLLVGLIFGLMAYLPAARRPAGAGGAK